ncbi:polysaccharide biosynthesis/export family protein [Flavobacterium sp. DGU38]|uniref:Polysaccharide biosynthesis/export family protein n=1 Tax=Flavobacterium calami TaxID=3139144 RepID=A0ABU9IMZ0_9FLAO
MKKLAAIVVIALFFCSCKTQNLLVNQTEIKADESFQYNKEYQYTIRKDDKISISVWGEDNLSVGSVYGIYNSNEVYGKWLMVDTNGTIEMPKIGTINVEGKTIPELKEMLKTALKKWLINPIVDVKVLNKEIIVLGEVRNPNTVAIDKDYITLLEIISKTGGFEFYANLKSVKILRQEGENVKVTNLDLTVGNNILNTNIQLHPGDIVIVPSKKNKEFDKRIATIIPLTTTISAAAIIMGVL